MLSEYSSSTSPSVYVNFHGLNAGDDCGTTYISSAILAFSQEELSTIAGQVQRFASSQQFNPGDLPCPPQSIMVGQPSEDGIMYFYNADTCSL